MIGRAILCLIDRVLPTQAELDEYIETTLQVPASVPDDTDESEPSS